MDINEFCVVGINYRNAPSEVRSLFAVNSSNYPAMVSKAKSVCIKDLLVLSTCNRTEVFSFSGNAEKLIEVLCSQTRGDKETFNQYAYIKYGKAAIEHIFNVAAGLDSQILGDYEIVAQLKSAVKLAKQHDFMSQLFERMINAVLQCSKLIKNNTSLSNGTVSVSFAAVQYIRRYVKNLHTKNILVLGVGKIGRNTCKNMVDYLKINKITLINRSVEKAVEVASELKVKHAPIENLNEEIAKADIILIATNSSQPLILKSQLQDKGEKLIIDLSVPYSVATNAHELSNIHIVNVDELSTLKDDTLKKRKAEVPKAAEIVQNSIEDFYQWYCMRSHASVLKDLKLKLNQINTHSAHVEKSATLCQKEIDVKIQRVINETAGKMKQQNQKGCQYLEALNNFISAKN